jgi:hypothetical protein
MIACVETFGIPAAIGGLLMVVLTNLGGIIPSSPGSIGIYHASVGRAWIKSNGQENPANGDVAPPMDRQDAHPDGHT